MTPTLMDAPAFIEQLAEPIRPEAEAGDYLRYERVYDKIAEARREERELPQGVWQRATKRADWKMVEELCTRALTEQTKDLQIAVWLTEAWLHLRGLPGLTAGLKLMDQLHHHFAFTMHPAPEPEAALSLPLSAADPAVEHRINNIQWLNEKLSIGVKLLPLTAPADTGSIGAFSLADIESAQLEEQMIRRKAIPAHSESQLHQLSRSIALTPESFLIAIWEEIRGAKSAAEDLDNTLDNCYGHANSGLGQIRQVLDEMALAIGPAIQPALQESLASGLAAGFDAVQAVHVPSPSIPTTSISRLSPGEPEYSITGQKSGAICSRVDAYARLHQIADYLAHLEPHSPVPYLLRRAIAWGGMSLNELLPELLQDQTSLQHIGHLLYFDRAGR